jgi:hypothetical protein
MKAHEIRSLDSDPRHATAYRKHVDAQLKVKRLEERIGQITTTITRPADLDAQARSYLESGKVPDLVTGPQSPELEELHAERRIAIRASDLARRDLEKVNSEISHQICREEAERNRELTQAQATALLALVEAAKDYKEFRAQFGEKGIVCNLPVGVFAYVGFSFEPDSGVAAYWLKEMKASGLIR